MNLKNDGFNERDNNMKKEFDNAVFIKPDMEFKREFSYKNCAPLFRKKFLVNELKTAKIYVCGLGYGYYYINGEAVSEDLFTAPVSNYNKTIWYNVYDVTDLLKKGENVFCAECGNGWFNESMRSCWDFNKASWRDVPKFIMRLEIDGKTALVTDSSWLCSVDGPTVFNQLRSGEYFDANKIKNGWTEIDYDDSLWENAKKDTTPPTGEFRECNCEPIREHDVYTPVNIIKTGDNKYVFDMGQNKSGYIRLKYAGKKGEVLTIRYGEELKKDYSIEYNNMDSDFFYADGYFQTDKFICSGEEVEWSPRFAYHGFRFIEIEGITDIENIDVKSVFVHQAVERRTKFECSNEMINKLFKMGVISSYSNMFYLISDCPSREKLGWLNDIQCSAEQMLTNFKIEKLLKKWLQDIKDAMLLDGSLPGIVPTYSWGYDWGNGPVADGAIFEIPYRIYLHTRNKNPLVSSIEYFDRYFAYLEKQKDEDGLVSCIGLDDWLAPGEKHTVGTSFINTVLIYNFYKIANFARNLADTSTRDYYKNKIKEYEDIIKSRFITGNGRCTIHDQCSVAMLIYHGIYDDLEPLKNQLIELVEEKEFHIDCGIVGVRRLYVALNKCGLHEYAYKIITSKGYPSYSLWIEDDGTALWEKWERYNHRGSDSKNHHMYSDFMSWIIKTLAGIRINEENTEDIEFIFEPKFIEDIKFVNCDYDTFFGKISIKWEKDEHGIKVKLSKDKNIKVLYKGKYVQDDGLEISI